jgi:SAM-dependent methyltransferase
MTSTSSPISGSSARGSRPGTTSTAGRASRSLSTGRSWSPSSLSSACRPRTGSTSWKYGSGTSPAACFLAARGYRVHAIDLSPTAIALARRFATRRGLCIEFEVQDVCALAHEEPTRRYDMVMDSFCLQSIVTDGDRADLLNAVRDRLRRSGFYLISTAMYDGRTYGPDEHHDPGSGVCELVIPAPGDGRRASSRRIPTRRISAVIRRRCGSIRGAPCCWRCSWCDDRHHATGGRFRAHLFPPPSARPVQPILIPHTAPARRPSQATAGALAVRVTHPGKSQSPPNLTPGNYLCDTRAEPCSRTWARPRVRRSVMWVSSSE